MSTIHYVPPTLTKTLLIDDLTSQVLAVAQIEQVKELQADHELGILNKAVKSSSQAVELDPPKSPSKMTGNFFDAMIVAMTELAGLMGDMADAISVELQFKKTQAKQLLEEKLATIKDREEQRIKAEEMQDKIEKSRKKGGMFSRVASFVFAAAEIVGGAALVATGTVTAQPALVAGGSMLVIAGTLEMAAEIVSMVGGSEKASQNLRYAAMGFMLAGMATASYGSYSAGSAAAIASKKAVQEGSEELAQKALKSTSDKMSKEITEAATEKMGKESLNNLIRFDEVKLLASKSATKKAATEATEKYFGRFIETLTKEAAENGVEMAGKRTMKEATEKAVREAAETVTKKAEEVSLGYKTLKRAIVLPSSLLHIGTGAYRISTALEKHDFDKREIELNHEIEELKSRLVEIMAKQEWVNHMIQLMQESWIRAVSGPVQDALKILGTTIQDHGAVTRRMSANV